MNYLQIREQYKLAYHRWDNYARHLCDLLGCSFADMEQRLLEARTRKTLTAEANEWARLSFELDRASDAWDTAQDHMARQALRRDFASLDC